MQGILRATRFNFGKVLLYSTILSLAASPVLAGCALGPTAEDDEISALLESVVIDVLANDSEPDGQAMSIVQLSTTCPAMVAVDFGLVRLTPTTALTTDCQISYRVQNDDGQTSGLAAVQVSHIPSLIFADGFEGGSASAWEACAPVCP